MYIKKNITKLFCLNLDLNESNNSYHELPVTAAVSTSCRNLKILTLFTTRLFLLELQKRMSVHLPLSLNPRTHRIRRQQKFSAVSTVLLLLGEEYVIKPSWLSDWGNYLSSSQLSLVRKDPYKNKLVFNIITSNCNSVCKIN
jgi:hypothetical protein